MKKRGFTLVEVLAVIVILAVLTILVLPNALKLYKDSKVRAFTSEIREIYRVANNQYVLDKTLGGFEMVYSKVSSSDCENKLPLSGRSNMEYYVKYNGQGKIIQFYATDGSYQYIYDGDGLRLDQIEDVIEVSKVADGRFIKLTCTTASIIKPPPESPDSYLMGGTASGEDANYLRTTIAKKNIEKITFTDSLGTHSTSDSNCWDVSAGQNGDVLVWAVDSDNNGKYELTIGANGDVYAFSGYRLFGYLINLTTIDGMEYFNTSKVTTMQEMFYNANSLTSLNMTNFDTSNVTNMDYMFGLCKNLTTLDLSSFNTSKVTNMNMMFYYCKSLTSLNLSNLNTSKVTNMGGMFRDCSSLTTLDVSHLDTSKVTNMYQMFQNCVMFTSLDLSHFDTSKVTNMSFMFAGDKNITSLDLSHLDTSNVTNMSSMFSGCSNLTTIDLSHFDTSNVTNMGSMFSGCIHLAALDLSHFNTSKVTNMSSMFSMNYAGPSSINQGPTEIIFSSNFNTSNVTDMSSMFLGLGRLESLDVSHFDTSKVTNMYAMFCGTINSNLVLDLSNFNTSNVTNMSKMFEYCGAEELDVSNFDLSKVTTIEYMFMECENLKRLNVGFDTSNVKYMRGVFSYDSSLRELDLSTWDTSNVVSMGQNTMLAEGMFYGCRNLKTIYVSNKWTTDAITDNNMHKNMFHNCLSLEGGAGTTYDSSKTDKTYAHVDGGTSNPGYFTLKSN